MPKTLHQGAIRVAELLREAGFEAYFAGGCVRDALLGKKPKDYDIATDALPEQVAKVFRNTQMIGAAFGVVQVRISGHAYEVATYRRDGDYLDGRRPDEIHYSKSKDEDVQRRDFTINALLEDPANGEVVDLVGGIADLRAGVIRAVGDAHERFKEDRLRMLRAVRFASRFEFELEPATLDAIVRHAPEIGRVSVERTVHELEGIWRFGPGQGALLLCRTGLASSVFGLSAASHGTFEERWRRLASVDSALRNTVGWYATLELLGPVQEDALRAFKLSRATIRDLLWLWRHHDLLGAAQEFSVADRLRILVHQNRELALAVVDVLYGADSASRQRLEADGVELAGEPLPAMPLLSGQDLKALGLTPGPDFKKVLAALETETLERRLRTAEEARDWVRARLNT